jgi:hypothetical protein
MARYNNEFMRTSSKYARYPRRPSPKSAERSDRYKVAKGDMVYVDVGPKRATVTAMVASDADERGEFLLEISPMYYEKAGGCKELRSTSAGLVVLHKWYDLKRSS